WAAYTAALEANPLVVKVGLTSFVGFAVGDVLAQLVVEKTTKYDFARTARLASFGLLIHGTTSHFFYGKLDSLIKGTTSAAVAKKVAVDQLFWNPCFGVMFLGYMGAIKRDLWTSVKGSRVAAPSAAGPFARGTVVDARWTVWPLANAINFKRVPSAQRVLYINSVQIFYNCFLSI
ncbi:hypothetical protein M885DRAFT_420817, partial [Pelagophyceae sp. CCMP2097]